MKRCLLALALSAWLAAPAHAQTDPAREAELTAVYQSAQRDFLDKRYTEALPQFEEVARALGSPNAQLYVARCLRALGRRVEAQAAMQRAVEMATAHPDRDKFEPTRAAAAAELAEIEAQLGRVAVVVDDPPEGLRVEVAGRALASLDARVFVEPGTVRIDALAPGRPLWRQERTVAAGALETVTIALAPSAVLPAPPPMPVPMPPPMPVTPPPERGWTEDGTIRILGYVAAGVGVAGWVTFAVAGVKANSLFDELEGACGGPCPDSSYQPRIDEGRTLDIVANVGLGVGIAGTVAGVLMIALGGASDDASGWLAPGGAGYRLRF